MVILVDFEFSDCFVDLVLFDWFALRFCCCVCWLLWHANFGFRLIRLLDF